MKWDQIFAALADRKDLSNEQVTWGMSQILEGSARKEDIKAFLTGLKAKGESAQGAVRTIHGPIPLPDGSTHKPICLPCAVAKICAGKVSVNQLGRCLAYDRG